DDSDHPSSLLALGHHHLDGVRGSAENRTDFGNVFYATEHIDGKAFTHHDDENVAGGEGGGIFLRQRLEFIVVAVNAREAGSGSFIEGYAEFHLRHRVYDSFVDVFNGFDEMSLPEDEV